MKAAGYAGAEIQAFNPGIPNLTPDERKRINDYANDAFFAHMQTVTEEALRAGFLIDYTLGSAWPSGGGFAITPELALVELTPAITSVSGSLSLPVRINLPKLTKKFGNMGFGAWTKDPRAERWKERLAARHKVVAIVAIKGDAPVLENGASYRGANVTQSGRVVAAPGIVLTDKLRPDGTLDWTPPDRDNWQIVAFSQFAVDSGVMAGVGEGPQLVLDHFDRRALEAHLGRVGTPLVQSVKKTLKAIRSTFVDSLELMQDLHWTEHFLDAFRAKRGYDLTPYLPFILQPGWMEAWGQRYSLPYFDAGDLGERVRHDYRTTLSDLLIKNFWAPFAKWNRANGLKAKGQAHGGPCDVLKAYGLMDVPETEDLESGGDIEFMRLARSAAHIYGKPIVSCESFVWKSEPYDVSPYRMLQRTNKLFVSGVTQIVAHGYAYRSHPEKWPGWFPFAPSAFLSGFSGMYNEANPVWPGIVTLNGYIGRMQGLLQSCTKVVRIAVYLGEIGYYHGIESQGRHEASVCDLLSASGYDADRINADGLLKSTPASKKLKTPGGHSYDALVFPPLDALPTEVALKTLELAKSGLPVVFVDRVPSRTTGVYDHSRRDSEVQAAVRRAISLGATQTRLADVSDTLAARNIAPNVRFVSGACAFAEFRRGQARYFLFYNAEPEPQNVKVQLSTGGAVHWDPLSATVSTLPTDGKGAISLDLAPDESVWIAVNDPQLKAQHTGQIIDRRQLPASTWSERFEGHGRLGRKVEVATRGANFSDWRALADLQDFSGVATYVTAFDLKPKGPGEDETTFIDLGVFHDLAEVSVNGLRVGYAFATGQLLDITAAARTGRNSLEVRIMNTLNNAMINPAAQGFRDLTAKPAGLLGPVFLITKK
ncbi:glycosyl hydrolase [Asticcacaulis sp. DXS10W]|uniref:Glycosyl hydrolase n=1 Tax=Asticcacaulis currens TaxID=2984210 RepID=A0ABT5IBE8_9CAUL|nr:glycosyl hydrolase [Asticcacaulis currens]MDC7693514.1 glycosyl hydrolase [Asticcacaulis currens]